MRYTLLALVCVLFSAAASQASIDLTPAIKEYTAEGISFRQLLFNDGNRQITYELPPGWTFRSVDASIKLVPPDNSAADVILQAIALPAPQPFDDNGIAAAREHFLQAMPPAVQSAKIISEGLNTVPFKAGPNYEITGSYQALGETFSRRSLYVNLPDTQLIFRLTARKNQFDGLWRTLRASILTWQWIERPASRAIAQKDPAPVTRP